MNKCSMRRSCYGTATAFRLMILLALLTTGYVIFLARFQNCTSYYSFISSYKAKMSRISMSHIRAITTPRLPEDNLKINLSSGIKFVNISQAFPYTSNNLPYPKIPSAKETGSSLIWNNVCMDFTSEYPIILWPNHRVLSTHLHPKSYDIQKRFVAHSDNIYPDITDEYVQANAWKEVVRSPLSPHHLQGHLNSLPVKPTKYSGFYTVPGRTLLINVIRGSVNAWHSTADGAFPALLTIQDLIEKELNFTSENLGKGNKYIPFERFQLNSIDSFFLSPTGYENRNNHQTPQNYFLGTYNKTNIWKYVGPTLRAIISTINLSKVKALVYDANSFSNDNTMICFDELIYRADIYDMSTPRLKTETVHYWRHHLNHLLQLPHAIPRARSFPGTLENPFRITVFGREDTWKRRWLNVDDFLFRIDYHAPKNHLDVKRYKSFGNLSLYQQVVIHSQTDLLIEIHGAGLTSIMWLPFQAIIVQIAAVFPGDYFGLMNRILNLTQVPVRGYGLNPPDKYTGRCQLDHSIPLHRCLVIPPGDIFDALSAAVNISLAAESE